MPLKGKGEKEGRRRGRKVDPKALGEIRAFLGDAPRRRDLLIEFLHRIQDHYSCISAVHHAEILAHLQAMPAKPLRHCADHRKSPLENQVKQP